MKINLILSDWVDERHLRLKVDDENNIVVFAGIELAAIKEAQNDYWKIKQGRCNGCGDCCTGITGRHTYPTVDGDCIHLLPENPQGQRLCAIPLTRSRLCDNDPREGMYERCSITYKRVKQK